MIRELHVAKGSKQGDISSYKHHGRYVVKNVEVRLAHFKRWVRMHRCSTCRGVIYPNRRGAIRL